MTMHNTIPQAPPDTAAELTALAAWIDEQLGDETAKRQWVAESAAGRIRDITSQMGAADLARGGEPLTPEQRDALGLALSDAIDYREARAGDSFCVGCEASHSGLCFDHAADFDRAENYKALAAQLSIEVDR
jgi:hypothetical protein